MSVLAVGFSW